ncbi:phosphate acyltransferase [Wenxinia marina]|uniref:Phosphotransacetylase n=1 Tax=Wenxinia marina DSM 24838 TaxID=1123501 RepID=A0A0D0PGW1_9RHOB|nr:phosphate acyltransferase [Wenxinia marina]KIQ70576.1 Phosphotransacetylase [Wenxinia marina DSM 24838]GGL52020.1 phosphate acetyl/butyryl transferase [Wenxinia marina]
MPPETFPFLSAATPVCPPGLLARAQALPAPRVALVNAGAAVPLQGLREAADLGLARPVLVGDRERIVSAADEIGWDIAGLDLVHAPREEAGDAAAGLIREGGADAVMKGQVHTSTFLKALLPSRAGLREKDARCGHVFHITLPGSERPLFLTDAALNVEPDVETRKACLSHAVRLARLLGDDDVKAGCLSASEDVTPQIPSSGEAAEIAAWAATALEAQVQGPMAMDLILSAAAARVKGFEGPVPGDADIVLVPEITTGNALFKLMVLGMGACAGGMVMGAKVPILLTSRSQQAPDRIASAALGAILAAAGPG